MNVLEVRQRLVAAPIDDVTTAVHRALDEMGIQPPRGEIAITAGSRGIDRIVDITRAAGDWLRAHGARPFLVPAMGSHNGATAEGQTAMLHALGLTPEATGLEIRASMDCVKIGEVASGEVWIDRHAHESAGVLVINRIKLHTAFSGTLQSGLTKMMVVGLGKIRSAGTFHSARPAQRADMLREMGGLMIRSGKIFAGLAILEDGYDQTAELHAMPGSAILEREPALLEKHRQYFPSLPCDELNVLIVDEIGKNYSGTGMDTNVIGRRGIRGLGDLDRPTIKVIGALGLSAIAQGNALGIGLADFITRRLRDQMDEEKTFINTITTGDMQRMAIPCTLANDEALIRRIRVRYGDRRWMFIPNTLHLEQLFVSEDLAAELRSHPRCDVAEHPRGLPFRDGRLGLWTG